MQFKKAYKTLCISCIFPKHWYFISFKNPAGGPKQKSTLGGPPLQSLSVDRGRAGAILIDIKYDDGDNDNDDDYDNDDEDDADDDGWWLMMIDDLCWLVFDN